jgi:hypothetical protein
VAFVLKKTASYKWEVKVEVPVDGNQFETQAFEAVFKKISRSAFNNLVDKGDDALVGEILLGWEGINDDAGKPVPFTEKNSLDPGLRRQPDWSYRKKLKDAAEYWAKGGVVDEREADLKALGASPEQIAALKLEAVEQHFEVWEENWDVVLMFVRMSTQWHTSMAGLTGLNYPSLEWLCKLYSVKDPVAIFEGVQVMEMAALAVLNAKSK